MLYLNNPLLTAQGIVDLYSKETKKGSRGLSAAEIVRRKLKFLFSPNQTISDEEIHSVWIRRFHEFPQYQDILRKVFSSSSDIPTLDESLAECTKETPDLNAINAEFGYFPAIQPDLLKLHHQLDMTLQKLLILEGQAYRPDMAYKLMVLFYNPDLNIQDNMAQIATNFVSLYKGMKEPPRPYHDALITELRILPKPTADIEAWKQFVKKHGFHALKYFRDAISIRRVPTSLQEADRLALHHRYARAGENLDFANMCKHHHVDEETFNSSLEYISEAWPRKTTDSLPVVDIADDEGQYFLVKLNPADPRALFLGNLTNCCQHMSGDSEFCVKEGVSLEHNGFYVLLKSKTGSTTRARIVNGEIDDEHFTVVAQSYAWRTQHDNLCLDSIEWKNKLVSREKISEMMQKFSASVFDTNPEIKYITVGSGGQTPEQFGPAVKIAEKMLIGQQYSDSKIQMLIAARKSPANQTHPYLSYIYPYLEEDLEANFPRNILEIDPEAAEKLPSKLSLLLSFKQEFSLRDFATLSPQAYFAMSEEERQSVSSLQKIWNMKNTYEEVLHWWPSLSEAEQLKVFMQLQITDDSFLHYLLNTQDASFIADKIQKIPNEYLVLKIKELNGDRMNGLHFAARNAENFMWLIAKLDDTELKQLLVASNLKQETPLQLLDMTPDVLTLLYRRLGRQDFIDLLVKTKAPHDYQNSILDQVIANPLLLNRLMLLGKSPDWLITFEPEMEAHINKRKLDLRAQIASLEEQNADDEEISKLKQELKNLKFKKCYPLHAAASNPISFSLLLDCYPNDQEKKEAIARLNGNKQNVLRLAAQNPDSLQRILDLYEGDDESFESLLHSKDTSNQSAIDLALTNPESLEMIKRFIKPQDIKPSPLLLSYPRAFRYILESFPDFYNNEDKQAFWEKLMRHPEELTLMITALNIKGERIFNKINHVHLQIAILFPESFLSLLHTCANTKEMTAILSQKINFRQNLFCRLIEDGDKDLINEIYRRFYAGRSDDFFELIINNDEYSNKKLFEDMSYFDLVFTTLLKTDPERLNFLMRFPNFIKNCSPVCFERILQALSCDDLIVLLKNNSNIGEKPPEFWLEILSKFQKEPEKMKELLQLNFTQNYLSLTSTGQTPNEIEKNSLLHILTEKNIGIDIIQSSIGIESSFSRHSLFALPGGVHPGLCAAMSRRP